nr:MAG TPA: hypothetical protein [Caudoviricetes sp.]
MLRRYMWVHNCMGRLDLCNCAPVFVWRKEGVWDTLSMRVSL